jgi:type IV pilus assembly protein PilA
MLSKLRERSGSESGFTLVELLVVMLILGILAAIAIPAFFNQRDKAKDSDAKSGARTAQTALETFATDNDGSFAGATTADLVDIEGALANYDGAPAGEPTLSLGGLADDTYTITVNQPDTGNDFIIERQSTGDVILSCDVDGEAGCPSSGFWD